MSVFGTEIPFVKYVVIEGRLVVGSTHDEPHKVLVARSFGVPENINRDQVLALIMERCTLEMFDIDMGDVRRGGGELFTIGGRSSLLPYPLYEDGNPNLIQLREKTLALFQAKYPSEEIKIR